ncbi:MAG: glycosyltransferase, partial [Nocardioides sp.]
ATGVEPEWLWILHDDSRPAPAALVRLLERVEQDPDADFVGPKLREWPSLRRLLEVGITMSGTGRRETGLERGEYDQGQHDESREVLAVHSAGLLARTTTFEALGGFDPQLPIFGNDLDLGWRAASAGYKTVVEPAAVVFHAEAAHRGIRRTPLTGRHTHYAERRAALYTLLANVRPGALPYAAVRIGFGSLVRVLGLLLVRSVGQALDELAALLAFYAHPRQIHQARRARHDLHAGDSERVAALLAPWWLPYRHGLDAVRDFASAATRQAQDVAERRRLAAAEAALPVSSARRAKVVAPPTLDDEEELPAPESGVMVRFLTSPVALLVTGFALLTVVGLRFSWGGLAGGELAGGALAPAPDSASVWWRSYLSGWQLLGQGTALSAPPYLAVLSALAAITPGGPNVAVGLLLTGAVPLGMWGMWRLLRVLGRLVHPGGFPTWLLAGGAATYALVPVTSGAYGSGQFGLVVLAALLPWLTHAALGFAEPEVERRWRAAWRTGLLLSVLTAFVPAAWWLAVVLTVAAFVAVIATTRTADRANWAPALVTLGVPLVLLCPWWLSLVTEGGSAGLFLDAGRLLDPVTGWSLLDGRVSTPPSGGLVGGGLVLGLLAAVALLPRATRLPVT